MSIFTLNYISSDVFTLNPDGTVYKNLIGATQLHKNRIGEFKKVVLEYGTHSGYDSIAGLTLYFVPALFISTSAHSPFSSSPPTSNYYVFDIDNSATPGTYDMDLVPSIGYNLDLIKNDSVQLEIIDSYNFKIHITFYQIYDLNSYLNPSIESNQNKLLKDLVTNPVLTVSGNSIYTNDKIKPRFYTILQNQDDPLTKGVVTAVVDSYRGGFYGKNELETSPYFTIPQWFLNNGADTLLSLVDNTKVDFWITSPVVVAKVDIWMIRTDTSDNSVDMRTNYEASFLTITTDGSTNQLDNKIYAPSQAPTFGGGVYKTFFHVDKTKIVAGGKYRFIGIVYYDGGSYEVNSFISDEYSVSAPSFTGINYTLTANIKDFAHQFDGNDLICVIEERLKCTASFNYSGNAFADDIFNRLGLTVPNDPRRYLTKITIQVYEDIATTRHYFDRIIISKQDPINYTSNPEITKVVFADSFDIQYDFRVRYESNVPNIETVVSGVVLITPTANQNWAGRDLRISIDYEFFYDDYSTPFTDIVKFIQKIHPKDYDNTLQILNSNDSTITESQFICSPLEKCYKAKLDIVAGDDYNLITNGELAPGSISIIEENEEWTGILPQLDSNKFTNQEDEFGSTDTKVAKFCLDSSNFSLNSSNKITAIAKKMRNLVPPFPDCMRITEDGDPRITDVGDFRITETCP